MIHYRSFATALIGFGVFAATFCSYQADSAQLKPKLFYESNPDLARSSNKNDKPIDTAQNETSKLVPAEPGQPERGGDGGSLYGYKGGVGGASGGNALPELKPIVKPIIVDEKFVQGCIKYMTSAGRIKYPGINPSRCAGYFLMLEDTSTDQSTLSSSQSPQPSGSADGTPGLGINGGVGGAGGKRGFGLGGGGGGGGGAGINGGFGGTGGNGGSSY